MVYQFCFLGSRTWRATNTKSLLVCASSTVICRRIDSSTLSARVHPVNLVFSKHAILVNHKDLVGESVLHSFLIVRISRAGCNYRKH